MTNRSGIRHDGVRMAHDNGNGHDTTTTRTTTTGDGGGDDYGQCNIQSYKRGCSAAASPYPFSNTYGSRPRPYYHNEDVTPHPSPPVGDASRRVLLLLSLLLLLSSSSLLCRKYGARSPLPPPPTPPPSCEYIVLPTTTTRKRNICPTSARTSLRAQK